ncbi:hypothetical protein [Pseudomonas sp. L1(2025)]|uniref:hypothetical protein n=1 Tax=Pseudomonas sp. L1(2025) TaxID=3449429 RepID=UPI003F68D7B8
MSFSINNSPLFKNDALPLDSKPSKGPDVGTPLSMSGAGLGHTPSPPQTEFSATLQRDGLNNAGVFTKLFDMFDQLVSAMREMFSGKAEIPNRLSHTDSAVPGKQDPGVQSVAPAHTQPQVKGSSSEVQSKSKLEEGSQPKEVPVAGVQTKERLPVGVLSKVISDVANQLKKKSSEDSHQTEPHAPKLSVLPRAREPGINVTSESNPQIKVEVNVNHCHCPDTSIEAGKDSRVIAGMTSRTHVPLPPERQVPTESVEGHVRSLITGGQDGEHVIEGKESHVESAKTDSQDAEHVIEGKESHVESAKTGGQDAKHVIKGKERHVESAETDGQDAEHVIEGKESHVESAKTGGQDAKHVIKGKERHVESAETDGQDAEHVIEGKESHVESAKTDGKDAEHASDDLTAHTHRDEVAESETSGTREATSEVSAGTKRGVTSPGPAENENDRWNQGFSNRSRLRN